MQDDRVHPTAAAPPKPIPPPPKSINGGAPTKPAPGPYNPTPRRRPTSYRPAPPPSRSGRRGTCRRLCCLCFLYTLIALLCLILLAAVAGTIFYFLYHPKHPSFSVSSLLITTFNLSSPTSSSLYPHVTSRLDLTILSKNPNSKLITFFYDPVTVSVSTEGAVDLGNSTVPGFVSVPGNVTVLAASVDSDPAKGQDPESVSQLKADLGKNGFPVDVGLGTQVRVRIGRMRSKSVGIRVSCVGIRGFVPSPAKKNGTAAAGETAQGKCKVDLRLKIWKFTLF
ncbi:hypothetical protein Droror1_Dr00024115 [Drosera rotundifolia]